MKSHNSEKVTKINNEDIKKPKKKKIQKSPI